MPSVNVNRQDLEALRNMIEQAHLIVSTEPMIPGGIPRLRELLSTAERVANFLVTDSPGMAKQAPRGAKLGRNGLKRR